MTFGIVDKGKSIAYDDFHHHRGVNMPEKTDWEARVQGILKAELKRRGVTYAQLVEKLAEVGVSETEPNVRNKLSRGKFTAAFFLQCLTAIGCQSVRLSED
jgi:3-mercaptopyruvate sulfurtransferase SseA